MRRTHLATQRPTAVLAVGFFLAGAGAGQAADFDSGQALYNQHCVTCHTHLEGLMDKSGPNLRGLFSRIAGTGNYPHGYTETVAQSGIQWSPATLDLFLQRPARMMPGTKMVFRGLDEAEERADLICYLQHATNTGNRPIGPDCERSE